MSNELRVELPEFSPHLASTSSTSSDLGSSDPFSPISLQLKRLDSADRGLPGLADKSIEKASGQDASIQKAGSVVEKALCRVVDPLALIKWAIKPGRLSQEEIEKEKVREKSSSLPSSSVSSLSSAPPAEESSSSSSTSKPATRKRKKTASESSTAITNKGERPQRERVSAFSTRTPAITLRRSERTPQQSLKGRTYANADSDSE